MLWEQGGVGSNPAISTILSYNIRLVIDKQTNILYKIECLKDVILDYVGDRYDINQWPDELQYDFDDVETIEIGITQYDIPITEEEMIRCNTLYKRYNI